MLFSDISIIDRNLEYRQHMWVGTKDACIAYIGTEAPADAASYGETYDGAGRLLIPGFYNAHAHAPMTILRGYADAMPLQAWLNDKIWPFEAKMTAEDNYWGTLLSCAEMLRYGTVSFSDMYYHGDMRFKAAHEAGMKLNSCEGILAFEPKPYSEYPVSKITAEQIEKYHGADDGRFKVDYNIHAEYTTNPITVEGIVEAAKAHNSGIHLHASETQSETQECRDRHDGLSPIAYFEKMGVFDVPTTAAHCVWATPEDIDILAAHNVNMAHCPVSNMKLGSGFAPVPAMLAAGVNVALGTDGCSSNNNLDIMQDMYVMGLAHTGNACDPTVITPQQVLHAATRAGALAQGRQDCGLLTEGYRADLCVLDITGPSWTPMTDAVSNVVYAGHGNDVCLTMVDGEVCYRDGAWPGIDVERAKAECDATVKRIVSEL